MKIIFTKHAYKKFSDLKIFGIIITQSQVKNAVMNAKYNLPDNGNKISAVSLNEKHNLRVIYKEEKGDIIIITFYIYKKGRYGEY